MYLVTGGAGFIGSHIVKALNDRGENKIIVVDDLEESAKFTNLQDCQISDYFDRIEFMHRLELGLPNQLPKAIFHQGACTDTMEYDGRYMMETNFTFSKLLFEFAAENNIPFIYASSAATYGNSRDFSIKDANERPLNIYGYSKLAFDQYIRANFDKSDACVVGLRYFNVYGPREIHKGKMASMVYQLYSQIKENSVARLFEGTDGYDDGEQRRDFVFVEDLVKINLYYAEREAWKGIVNAGTGKAQSFNEVARAIFKALGKPENIEYIPFDKTLTGKYQSFTEADLTSLRESGYKDEFSSLEDGVLKAVEHWSK